jgi:hypothetical protein
MIQYLFAILIGVGLIGNFVNMLIYCNAKMRKSLTFQLLIGLSITDFIILLLCGVESGIENKFDVDLRAHSIIACKLDTFLTYFLTQTRNLLSMAITVESKNDYLFKRFFINHKHSYVIIWKAIFSFLQKNKFLKL